jgi:SAM-dependent methyltransferase
VIKQGWILIGLASFYVDAIRHRLRSPHSRRFRERVVQTGRVVTRPERPEVSVCLPGVHLIRYPGSCSHSLWRSQELSLFAAHRDRLPEPRLDFGCGDGSFALALFDHAGCGIDRDQEALRTAVVFRAYDLTVCGDGAALPFASGVFRSVWANSALEHADDPRGVLKELQRVLGVGGRLAFTVPTCGFTRHLERYFGHRESALINHQCDHRHLHEPRWWQEVLENQRFSVEVLREYQPDWFTFTYRAMNTGAVVFALRFGIELHGWYRRLAAKLVRASIAGTSDGANLFVLARRLH